LALTVVVETGLLWAGDIGGSKTAPIENVNSTSCQDPAIRREWRYLEPDEKQAFLSAVLCLYDKRSLFPGRGSRYDDIVYVHQYSGQAGKFKESYHMPYV
jgi:hypothetical protein